MSHKMIKSLVINTDTSDARLEYLVKYGTFTMAYSTLQPLMDYYEIPFKGYIGFTTTQTKVFGKKIVAFFDPVSSQQDRAYIINNFISKYPQAAFVQVSRETAQILANAGYYINQIGVETKLWIDDFSFAGTPRSRLREAQNRGHKEELSIVEITDRFSDDDKICLYEKMKALSKDWMNTRKVSSREVIFITRCAQFHDEPFVRKFIALNKNGDIEGFTFYDPIFDNGEVIGYTPSIERFSPHSVKGINYFTSIRAIDIFKRENIKVFELGLSPLYNLCPVAFKTSRLTFFIFNMLFTYGERLYGFKGLSEHKRQYRGKEYPVFAATKARLSVGYIYNTLKHINII